MRKAVLYVVVAGLLAGCLGKEDIISPNEQFEKDVAAIDSYLAANNIDAIVDKSGIRLKIDVLGTKGLPPNLNQRVTMNYRGTLLGGAEFDSGLITSEVNDFVTGMQAGLLLLPPGSEARIFIPSALGYGNQQYSTIPANSNLVFEVEVVEVALTVAEKQQLASDIGVVDSYLADKGINAVKDTTGVRYVINAAGGATKPTWFTKVRFSSVGKVMVSGTTFFSGVGQPNETFDSRVIDYLHGIKVALHKIGVGGKITVYVPSGLAFGTEDNTSQGVPPNSNLIYEIELLEIIP